MKKLSLFIVLILAAVMLFGCSDTNINSGQINVDKGTAWSDTTADKNLVGAWQIEGSTADEIRLFTEDCQIKIASGSVYLVGDVAYGIDSDGNRKYMSDFYYMAGELDYVVNGDTVVFTREDGTTQTMNKVEYTTPQLTVYENFKADNPLVGTWHNEEYNDTYVFSADGTATYDLNNTEESYKSHIDYTYREEDGKIYFTYDSGDGLKESISTYVIKDSVLNIDGAGEYVLQ